MFANVNFVIKPPLPEAESSLKLPDLSACLISMVK